MDQMCNVKCVACSDDRTENYHPNSAVLQRFLVSLGSLFWLLLANLLFWFRLTALISVVSSRSKLLFSAEKRSD